MLRKERLLQCPHLTVTVSNNRLHGIPTLCTTKIKEYYTNEEYRPQELAVDMASCDTVELLFSHHSRKENGNFTELE